MYVCVSQWPQRFDRPNHYPVISHLIDTHARAGIVEQMGRVGKVQMDKEMVLWNGCVPCASIYMFGVSVPIDDARGVC